MKIPSRPQTTRKGSYFLRLNWGSEETRSSFEPNGVLGIKRGRDKRRPHSGLAEPGHEPQAERPGRGSRPRSLHELGVRHPWLPAGADAGSRGWWAGEGSGGRHIPASPRPGGRRAGWPVAGRTGWRGPEPRSRPPAQPDWGHLQPAESGGRRAAGSSRRAERPAQAGSRTGEAGEAHREARRAAASPGKALQEGPAGPASCPSSSSLSSLPPGSVLQFRERRKCVCVARGRASTEQPLGAWQSGPGVGVGRRRRRSARRPGRASGVGVLAGRWARAGPRAPGEPCQAAAARRIAGRAGCGEPSAAACQKGDVLPPTTGGCAIAAGRRT